MWWIHEASKWYLPGLSSDKPKILPVHIHAWSQGAGGDVFFVIHGGLSLDWMLDLAVMQLLLASKWAVSCVAVDGHDAASPRALPPSSSLFLLFLSGGLDGRTYSKDLLPPTSPSGEQRTLVWSLQGANSSCLTCARSTLQEKPLSGCS